jgi:uncharacterized membrane protein
MIGNSLLATVAILIALILWLMEACQFLIPYRAILWHQYGRTMIALLTILAINIFAGVYLLCRKAFLKDTGRKLAHVDKQLRSGESIAEELSKHLRD